MGEETQEMWMPAQDVDRVDRAMVDPAAQRSARPRRRRVRGLRMSAVPSGPLTAQVVGAVAAMVGITLLWGLAVTLLAGGVACVALGALREAGKV